MSQRSRVLIHVAPLIAVIAACEQPITGTESGPGAPFLRDEAVLTATRGIGRPLPSLSPDQRRLFERGSIEFQVVFTPQTGLGPLFNADACAACHEVPVVGGGGETEEEPGGVPGEDIEVHATAFQGGVCDALSAKGGPVFQKRATPALAALGINSEEPPAEATAIANRTTPDLFGFGLLDAVPDTTILALADPDDRNGDGISGRPNRSRDGRLGRFGRKAAVPTLRQFNDGAFVLEMGITNPAVPREESIGGDPVPDGVDPTPEPEITQEAIDATDAFVRFLAPPTPPRLGLLGQHGRRTFARIGCTACHVPALKTGDHAVRALRDRVVQAYTDLLLHDMGPGLADICLGLAEPSEFRTEPLMGLRFATAFLHDGRAQTIEQAIELHGGEASAARDRFAALSPLQRVALLRFLKQL
jgi:CxxC motif-containing protein (DUF1111 family)